MLCVCALCRVDGEQEEEEEEEEEEQEDNGPSVLYCMGNSPR